MEIITQVNGILNAFIWGLPAMVCIIGVGLYLSFKTGFIQIRKFPYALRCTIGRMFKKKEASDGAITPFQAVCTALAATVGTGNIAGVAGAIAIGGPGAVFWMWISALLGMCTKFFEVTLAVHFRERNDRGELVGGPMYYIKNGLGKKWMILAYAYAFFGVCAVFGTGNATQVNTITAAIDAALLNFNLLPAAQMPTCNLIIGIVICIVVGLILIGGIKRIGKVSEKLVPLMALLYVLLALGIIVINAGAIPAVFAAIFEGAFKPSAVIGGIVGSFFLSMKKGVSRGIFSNEAGLGTGSIAHACSDTDDAVQQGYFGIFEVFMDTIVICSLTALTIICSGVEISFGVKPGSELIRAAFATVFGEQFSALFVAVALMLFAFSTVLGWALYGSRCIQYLFGGKSIRPYQIIFAIVIVIGCVSPIDVVWDLADTFNGLMAVPNFVAIFALSGVVAKLTKEHFANPEAALKK